MGDMFGPNPERGMSIEPRMAVKPGNRFCIQGETDRRCGSMTFDPTNPEVILASMNHHVTYPWDEESGGPTSGLFEVPRMAGTPGRTSRATPVCQQGLVGKICIAISPAQSSRVYAFIEADKGEGGIYRSDDGGSTWQRTHHRPRQDGDPQFLQPHHSRYPGSRCRLYPAHHRFAEVNGRGPDLRTGSHGKLGPACVVDRSKRFAPI